MNRHDGSDGSGSGIGRKRKLSWSFWLRFRRASDSASNSSFWFTLDRNITFLALPISTLFPIASLVWTRPKTPSCREKGPSRQPGHTPLSHSVEHLWIPLNSFILWCAAPGNDHAHPMEGHWRSQGGGVSLKPKNCKGKFEAKLKFWEEWGWWRFKPTHLS